LIILKVLNTRSALKDLRELPGPTPEMLKIDTKSTAQSKIFHVSLKYALVSDINPYARILMTISAEKRQVNAMSQIFNTLAKIVSGSDKGLSTAKQKLLKIMSKVINKSNFELCATIKQNLRIGLSFPIFAHNI
jgi:hypothetical protein